MADRTNTSGSRVGQIKLRREHTWPHKNHLIHKKAAARRMSDHGTGNPSAETALGFSWWKKPFSRLLRVSVVCASWLWPCCVGCSKGDATGPSLLNLQDLFIYIHTPL